MIATPSTAEKAERLKALGASDVINYTETPDWDAKVRELNEGRGVDCIVEIGGPGTIAMSLKALAVGGHVSLIGASLSSSRTGLDPLLLTGRGITVGSISVGSRADFETMNRAIAMHRLHPVVDRTFPFAEAKEAHRHFEGRGHLGKVVITHGGCVGPRFASIFCMAACYPGLADGSYVGPRAPRRDLFHRFVEYSCVPLLNGKPNG